MKKNQQPAFLAVPMERAAGVFCSCRTPRPIKTISSFKTIAGSILAVLLLWLGSVRAQAQSDHVENAVLDGIHIGQDTIVQVTDTIKALGVTMKDSIDVAFYAGRGIIMEGKSGSDFMTSEGSYFIAETTSFLWASKDISDAFVDLRWRVYYSDLNNLPEDNNGELYIQLLDGSSLEELYADELYVQNVYNKGWLQGVYRHYVGAAQDRKYILRVRLKGNGRLVYSNYPPTVERGSTIPYRTPSLTLSADGEYADRVIITITNNSDLVAENRIYRDGKLLTILPVTDSISTYADAWSAVSNNSLVSGQTYEYCVVPYSSRYVTAYDRICSTSGTFPIGLSATDNAFPDRVALHWNDVSGYATTLAIIRDGKPLTTMPAAGNTTYTDIRPVHGVTHEYGLQLYDAEEQLTVTAYDTGSVLPDGTISGHVMAGTGDFGIPGVLIVAAAEVRGRTRTDSAFTDETGYYRIDSMVYGEEAEFTVTASLSGHTFADNDRIITLERGNAEASNIDFIDEFIYAEDSLALSFDNLQAVAQSPQDWIQLRWEYTPPSPADTVLFKVYRKISGASDSTFMALISDEGVGTLTAWEDLTGSPGQSYDYTVQAYVLKATTYTQVATRVANTRYPQTGVRAALAGATANTTLGVVDIAWTYAGVNFDGFQVYRDDALIADLPAAQTGYADYGGTPGQSHTYGLATYVLRANAMYVSDTVWLPAVVYPVLPVVVGFKAKPQPNNNQVNLFWSWPTVHEGYNYDGANFYREHGGEKEYLGTVLKAFDPVFEDKTGIPGVNYQYLARVMKYNEPNNDESDAVATVATYPILKAPTGLTTVSNTGYVSLSWDTYCATCHDGFLLVKDSDTLAWLPPGTTTYSDAITEDSNTPTSAVYALQAYAEKGSIYYSSAIATTGVPLHSGGGHDDFPDPPANFTASDDVAGHVLLKWDYPAYILARFTIYRDGDSLATLGTDYRVYYDYAATPGTSHVYGIQAVYDNVHNSYRVSDPGRLGTVNVLTGTVATPEGYGVPHVEITATASPDGNTWVSTILTDSSGFYRITGVPNRPGTPVTVSAVLQNHIFEENTMTVTIAAGQRSYVADFIATTSAFGREGSPQDQIATPVDVIAIPDDVAQHVTIRWNVASPNYTGFKVYRNLREIADVPGRFSRVVIDSTGSPGIDYTYLVETYWQTALDDLESDRIAAYVAYPQVPPVTDLQAAPLDQEDKVRISWSHPSDRQDYYIVYRSDEPIGVVKTGQPLFLEDTTGSPGRNYNYSIQAVKIVDGAIHPSRSVSRQATFPLLSQVTGLREVIPKNENHIVLTWNHTSTNFDGYFIQRNGVFIDTLSQGTYTYTDPEGIPDASQQYRITTYVARKGITFLSVPVVETVAYPALLPPVGVKAITVVGGVEIVWGYNPQDISGFNIYRDDDLIGSVAYDDAFSFTDPDGTPGAAYTYRVEAYDWRNEVRYVSEEATAMATYPTVPAPVNVQASDGDHKNYIAISWEYDPTNESGFYLYRNGSGTGTPIATLDAGVKSYKDVQNGSGTQSRTYTVKAFRVVDGATYKSPPSAPDAGSTSNLSGNTIASVTASDGEYSNRTLITWTTSGLSGDKTVKIYREGTLLDAVDFLASDAGEYTYYDDFGVPGKKYVYRVVYNDSSARADMGYRQSNGTIRGSVVTLQGNHGVPGVEVIASATVEGSRYQYTTETDASGEFEIDPVYYGEAATYRVAVSYPGHEFTQDSDSVDLHLDQTTAQVPVFLDETAFLIAGTVARQGSSCGLDSIRVVLQAGGNEQETYTDASGTYAFTINPMDTDIAQYIVTADTSRTFFEESEEQTTWFDYADNAVVIPRTDDMALVTPVDFTDTVTYEVVLTVTSTCGPIGENKFEVQVASTDGCFIQTYQTRDNGRLIVDLPPLEYKFTVTGVEVPTPATISVVDYLRVRPAKRDLYALHRSIERGETSPDSIADKLKVNFVFHTAPIITVSGAERYCGDENIMVFSQGESYTLALTAQEQHGTALCPVNEGYLIVKNAGAAREEGAPAQDTIRLKKGTTQFERYAFTAGEPNIVSPHTLALVVEYHTEDGGYQGQTVQAILLEGSKAPEGNDIIVSLDENNGTEVQLPLFVLRDPPGDGSYSYISEGHTFQKMLTVKDKNSGHAGLKTEFEFAVGLGLIAGVKLDIEATAGGGDGESASFIVSGTTTQTYQTSETSEMNELYLYGEDADVIVGAGLAIAYGIIQTIAVNEEQEGCVVDKTTAIGFAPGQVTTQWSYTVRQIKQLVGEYERQMGEVLDGTLSLGCPEDEPDCEDPTGNVDVSNLPAGLFDDLPDDLPGDLPGDVTSEQQKDYVYLAILRYNWQQMLHYHRNETAPHFNVCRTEGLPEPFRTAFEGSTFHTGFCAEVIKDDKLNPEFIWTKENMEAYNALRVLKDGLEDYIKYSYKDGVIDPDNDDALIITEEILEGVDLDEEYKALYEPSVENYTFDAGSSFSKEVSISRSQSRGFHQSTFFDANAFVGVLLESKTKVTASGGIGAEVGTEQDAAKLKSTIGLVANYHFEFEKEQENTVEKSATVGYVLADGDAGDQFSVTVVQGIDPNHTPYFDLLGGRSSCPHEPGTIQRYDPLLFIEMPNGSFSREIELWNVDPEKPASVDLVMASGNLFGEQLLYYLFVPTQNTPNQDNAEIVFQGLGENALDGTFFIDPNLPQRMQVDIYRREGDVYDYEDIQLAMVPQCEINFNYVISEFISIKVHFRRPCSEVSLVVDGNRTATGGGTADGEGWIVYKAPEGKREYLFLKLVDYAPASQVLEYVTLEYRPEGTNHWTEINGLSNALTADSLLSFYNTNILTYLDPTYPYVWDITDRDDLVDGKYEIRARTFCGVNGENYSNVLTGTIDRTSLQVYGRPEPADGILSLGDDIAVRFNEQVKCTAFDRDSVSLVKTDGTPVPFTVACHPGLGIELQVADSLLSDMEGDTLIATVAGVQDRYGNALEEPAVWSFVIHHNPVYWFPDSYAVELYQGSEAAITAQLYNTSEADLSFSLSGQDVSWLSVDVASGSIPPSGRSVAVGIDARQLTPGVYQDTITAFINGYSEENLVITAHVAASPPDWEVPPVYEHNMTAIAHFTIDSVGTSDTLDIVSVWVDNTVRGVANIRKVSSTLYRAYLTIGGGTADIGSALQFRVWDASTGIEYEGIPDQVYTYDNDKYVGTTAHPVELSVNTVSDLARYIPITNQWSWISFNTEEADMSLNNYLSDIVFGDASLASDSSMVIKLKTGTSMSEYSPQNGWVSADGLDTIDTRLSYRVKLISSDSLQDTKAYLRVTGADASVNPVVLTGGWNMIGYPLQEAGDLNEVLANATFADEDIFKSYEEVAEYSESDTAWYGMEQLIPNRGYHVRVSDPLVLNYSIPASPGGRLTAEAGDVAPMARKLGTHQVVPSQYQYNMTFTATVAFADGSPMAGSHVVARVGEECRGIGRLVYSEALGREVLSLFVYANSPDETVTFTIVDKNGYEYAGTNTLSFVAGRDYGTIKAPYTFVAGNEVAPESRLTVYPNVSDGKVSVRYFSTQAGSYTLEVSDLLGATVYTDKIAVQAGWNEFGVNIADKDNGMYHLTVRDVEDRYTTRLIKVK